MIHYFNDILPCYLIFDSIIFKKKEKYQEKTARFQVLFFCVHMDRIIGKFCGLGRVGFPRGLPHVAIVVVSH